MKWAKYTVWPRSLVHSYIVSVLWQLDKTSGTFSMTNDVDDYDGDEVNISIEERDEGENEKKKYDKEPWKKN